MNPLIEKFYNSSNLGITKEACNDICSNLFDFVKHNINIGNFKDIRLQYFGVIEVNKPMIIHSKKTLQSHLDKGYITQDRFDKRMKILNSYEE